MGPKFLQTSHHDFCQMALAVTVGDLDGLVEFSFTQRAGHRRSKSARLGPGAVISDQAIDHNADGPCRHKEKYDHHDAGQPAHLLPHVARVELDGTLLKKEESPNLQLN